MSQNPKVHAALVIACLALVLSIYAAVRGPSELKPAGTSGSACVDQVARDQASQLRRALAERDALVARLTRAANAGSSAGEPLPQAPEPSLPPPPADQGPRRYTHFAIPNPAVTVTQKPDGTYDIRTTDPALAGTILQITAVTESGDEDKMLIRIPQ